MQQLVLGEGACEGQSSGKHVQLAPDLEHGEQRREGGIDDRRQRGAVVLILELVLARQHAQHVQRAPYLR